MRDSVRAARGPPVTHFHTVWGRQGPLSKHCGFLECFPSSVLWLSEKVLVNLPPGFIPHSVPSICFSSPPRSLSASFWLPFRSDFSSQISSVLMSHSWSFWGTWRTDRAADGEAARDPTLDPLRALCLSPDKDESLRRRGLGVRFDMDFLRRRGRQRELIWDQGLSPLPSWVTCQCEAQPLGCYRYSDRPKYLFTRLEKQHRLNIWAESGKNSQESFLSTQHCLLPAEFLLLELKRPEEPNSHIKMPAKTPMYLKTTTPKKGKKLKLRDVLSGDMISPPLGDVRHSAHVGPEGEGDMFGDVGFLQGKMDMLPPTSRTQNGHARSHSVERDLGEGLTAKDDVHSYAFNGFHYQHSSSGLLKNTISMPVFIAHEQAPPKPPRLHLDGPSHHHQQPPAASPKQNNGCSQTDGQRQQHPTVSLCENGVVGRLASEPCRDISLSPAIHRLVPSSGSLSEGSSEDSMSEICGPQDVRRGLSLDSDTYLSNEDLRSERSESPCTVFHHAGLTKPSGVSRSDSIAGLNLDLGPSILEDVLSIMDRYKAEDNHCELWLRLMRQKDIFIHGLIYPLKLWTDWWRQKMEGLTEEGGELFFSPTPESRVWRW